MAVLMHVIEPALHALCAFPRPSLPCTTQAWSCKRQHVFSVMVMVRASCCGLAMLTRVAMVCWPGKFSM